MKYQKEIRAGQLQIQTRFAQRSLEELLAFATRENPLRGFYFVSRVMGKHFALKPRVFRRTLRELAEKVTVDPAEPMLVVGLGEAATGLGAGVAECLAERCDTPERVLYMHTTRHRLGMAPLIEFDECHSHAPNHMLYPPKAAHEPLFRGARHLVLVDDEITSGRTITLLARKLCRLLPGIARVTCLSLVSWLEPEGRPDLAKSLGAPLVFRGLLEGSFRFKPRADWRGRLPADVDGGRDRPGYSEETGRRGLRFTEKRSSPGLPSAPPKEPLLVLGNGEFLYQPFLLAEALEARGFDVLFLSTTRSPLLVGDAVNDRLSFPSRRLEGHHAVNYLYNAPRNRRVLSCYENDFHAAQHGLEQHLDCRKIVFSHEGKGLAEYGAGNRFGEVRT